MKIEKDNLKKIFYELFLRFLKERGVYGYFLQYAIYNRNEARRFKSFDSMMSLALEITEVRELINDLLIWSKVEKDETKMGDMLTMYHEWNDTISMVMKEFHVMDPTQNLLSIGVTQKLKDLVSKNYTEVLK